MALLGVVPVPVLEDNYAYILYDKTTLEAGIVDGVDPSAILPVLRALGLKLTCILTTHKHWDHAGGNLELAKLFPDIPVYGGKGDSVPGVTHEVANGDTVSIGGLKLHTSLVPCHTRGHVLYNCFAHESGTSAVFTGDTLFIGGCGRFFEGTAEEMHYALNTVIAALDDDTLVYCGHEYTQSNMKFALHVEPENEEIKAKLKWAGMTKVTVPSTVAEEKRINPFMRVDQVSVKQFSKCEDPVLVMQMLRDTKNKF